MTPILERVIAALLAILVMVGLGFAVYVEHERADAAEDKVAGLSASLAASQAALDAYATAAKATAQRAATNQKKVSSALQANPDWTRTSVPDDVFNSLYGNRPGAAASSPAASVPRASASR